SVIGKLERECRSTNLKGFAYRDVVVDRDVIVCGFLVLSVNNLHVQFLSDRRTEHAKANPQNGNRDLHDRPLSGVQYRSRVNSWAGREEWGNGVARAALKARLDASHKKAIPH